MRERDPLDVKGLIWDAYRIDGITWGECRSIFLDWALSLPEGADARDAIDTMIARYSGGDEEHPMTKVLREGQGAAVKPKRRGGWRSRDRSDAV